MGFVVRTREEEGGEETARHMALQTNNQTADVQQGE
jgi:hypothetical protein